MRRYGATVVSQSALECELLHLSLRWVTGMAKGRLSGCADGPCVVRFGMDMKKRCLAMGIFFEATPDRTGAALAKYSARRDAGMSGWSGGIDLGVVEEEPSHCLQPWINVCIAKAM